MAPDGRLLERFEQMKHVLRFTTVLVLAAVLAGCGSDAKGGDAIATQVRTATLKPGDPVPKPTGKVVLTLTGDISTTNVGTTLQFDLATLERLGLSEYRADDYQAEGKVVTFRGPLLRTILDVAGAGKGAKTLSTVALNDYKADVPISDADAHPVLMATSVDGDRMPVDRYGPIRIVYPNLDETFDKTVYDARWVWQLRSIAVH